jgi:hypothetical protein
MTPLQKYIVLALLVLAYAVLAWVMWVPHPPHYDPVSWPEKKWVVERMKHHGIEGCIWDGERYYFYRDGRKVRL